MTKEELARIIQSARTASYFSPLMKESAVTLTDLKAILEREVK